MSEPPVALAGAALAVEAVRISKSFGGVRALREASFAAISGEVHALVGENGAGKSTLIKVLAGRLSPDSGVVRIKGREALFSGPDDAHALGAWMVFQELTLLPWMTVAENLLLKREPRGASGLISRRQMTVQAERMMAALGIDYIDPMALIDDLSLAERQIVEIVRAITHDPEILFLDEPTSSLVDREAAWLFEQIRRLRGQGVCVVFTSHRWNEVKNIADRITVFRNGGEVGTYAKLDEDEAIALMTGTRVEALYPPPPPLRDPKPALEVKDLAGPNVRGLSLGLRKGEILGVGGLAGHGHRELFFMLFGALTPATGVIAIDGRPARVGNPRDAIRHGVALVPEDRKTEGLLLSMGVRDNLTLTILRRISQLGVLRAAAERRLARGVVDRLKVRARDLAVPVATLSGGNQQKVLLGRWLLAECQVMLMYDVTRGVDVTTKHEIYELMSALASKGAAILFYSSDAEELARLSHRVLVMREGQIAAELNAPGVTAEHIIAAAVRERLAA
jgi:ribose transport system ATP-binding protein